MLARVLASAETRTNERIRGPEKQAGPLSRAVSRTNFACFIEGSCGKPYDRGCREFTLKYVLVGQIKFLKGLLMVAVFRQPHALLPSFRRSFWGRR